jgi:DNA primase
MLNEEFVLARVRSVSPGGRPPGPPRSPLRAEAGQAGRAGSSSPLRGEAEAAPYNASDPVVNLERQALKLAIQRPALCGPVFDALGPDDFTVPVHRAVREIISDCGGVAGAKSARDWAAQLIGAAPHDRAREFVTRLAVESIETPRKDGEPDARYAEAVLAQVEDLTVSRQITELKSRLQRVSPVEGQDYNRTFGDLVSLEQRHKALMGRASGAL